MVQIKGYIFLTIIIIWSFILLFVFKYYQTAVYIKCFAIICYVLFILFVHKLKHKEDGGKKY